MLSSKCYHKCDHVLVSQAQPVEILHSTPQHCFTAAHYDGENLCRGTAQPLLDVVGGLLVFPGLLAMGVGQACFIFVPDCDVDDHQPILVFDNQIPLLQIAAYVHNWLDEGGESLEQSSRDDVLDLIMSPIEFVPCVQAHPGDMP